MLTFGSFSQITFLAVHMQLNWYRFSWFLRQNPLEMNYTSMITQLLWQSITAQSKGTPHITTPSTARGRRRRDSHWPCDISSKSASSFTFFITMWHWWKGQSLFHVTMCEFATYIFFLAPFLPPLVSLLFLPTAMLATGSKRGGNTRSREK